MGRDSREQDKWESAARSIEAALTLNPDDANALAARGLLLLQQDRLADAEEVLRRALALDPNIADARVWLGSTLAAQDRPEEAEAEFATALALDPLDPRLATSAATKYKEQGNFKRAEEQYQRLLEQPRPSEFVYNGLFFLYDEYGRHVELIAAGKERILAHAIPESEPQYYYAFLAYSYARIGMNDKAEYWQSRAESAPRVDLATHLRRTYIYRLQGRTEEGMEHLRQVLAETKQDIENSGPFIQRVVGASWIAAGDHAAGADLIESTFDIGESVQDGFLNLDFLQYAAWAQQHLGNAERAGELLVAIENGILELQADGLAQSPQMLFVFAQNHLLKGNIDAALDTLETAIDRGFRRYFWLLHDSRWDPLHDNERFRASMARLKGYIDEQRAEVERIDAEDDFIARLEAKLAAGSP
jgi:tetratricopeptide (TPR) repeat protein